MSRYRSLDWIVPTLILAVAAVLRLWALGRPDTLVFDELYYVRDAISQLGNGYPTSWPDNQPDMSGYRASAYLDEASYAVHPPLGKWIIGLGVLLFGAENPWGWRIATAICGVLTVAATMRLGWVLSRNRCIAWAAGLLLAIDGVHIVLSRVGLLDGLLTMFIVIGAVCAWHDVEHLRATFRRDRQPAIMLTWRRPWLLAAALAFGAAASVKWSGLYPLAAFLIFITIVDLILRLQAAKRRLRFRSRRSATWASAILQAGITALIALPVTLATYLLSWVGWIINPGGWARDTAGTWWDALWTYHRSMFEWHSTLQDNHPYQSSPLTWPLALRPTGMYELNWGTDSGCNWQGGCVAAISPFPNPIVTWGAVLALLILVWIIVRGIRRGWSAIHTASAFVLTGFLSGWLPWILTLSRNAVFQFYAVVLTPFSALALSLVIGVIAQWRVWSRESQLLSMADRQVLPLGTSVRQVRARRLAVMIFLGAAFVVALWFFPLWSGMPVAHWFWQLHLWLPGWD